MKPKISFLLLGLALLMSCQQTQPAASAKIKKGMIKVAILYPNGEGKTFDMPARTERYVRAGIIIPPSTCPWPPVYLEIL